MKWEILAGNEFGVPLAEQQPKRNGTHEEVGEVFIERDFLLHGRQGVGDAGNIIKICNVICTTCHRPHV